MIDTFFRYLWFVITVAALVLVLKCAGEADKGSRELDPIPDYVTQPGHVR